MIKSQMFIAAALFVGVAIGYFLRGDKTVETPASDAGSQVTSAAIPDVGADANINALKARIAALERELSVSRRRANEVAVAPDAQERPKPPSGARPPSFREELERIRKEDPKRYDAMTNRMARFRAYRRQGVANRLDYLASIDVSSMSDEQKSNHERYQSLITRHEELEDRMHDEGLSDDERHEVMKALMENDRQTRQLAQKERTTLVSQAVGAVGLGGDEAVEFTAALEDILKLTETRNGPPPGPRPGDK